MRTAAHRYETPASVAQVLAQHAPKRPITVLDPAVGGGALLEPLRSRIAARGSVVCVDVDRNALRRTRRRLQDAGIRAKCLHGDFLELSKGGQALFAPRSFDCVVMNPPFAAKKAEWVRLESTTITRSPSPFVPVEMAFVFRGIELLRDGGRLLAILPSSLISASLFGHLRGALAQVGRLHFVHELPRFTFDELDARVYLLVFERGGCTAAVELRNHDLREPECLKVSWPRLGPTQRLDFGFQASRLWLDKLVTNNRDLVWRPLGDIARITRGPWKSPGGPRVGMHTTDLQDGVFWEVVARHRTAKGPHHVRSGDLLIARVSRSCTRTLGIVRGGRKVGWTDCVFRMRCKRGYSSAAVLLAARVMLGLPQVRAMLERGTGATFMNERELAGLRVPLGLTKWPIVNVQGYKRALRRRQATLIKTMEDRCRTMLIVGKRRVKGAAD